MSQISSPPAPAGADAEERGARGAVRGQERDQSGGARDNMHDKMLLRSGELSIFFCKKTEKNISCHFIRCWMSEQAEIVSV